MQKWSVVPGVLAGIVAVILIAALGATSGGTREYKPDVMAYWIQGVGSIAAIVGSFWVGRQQLKQQVGSRRAAVVAIAEAASDLAISIGKIFEEENPRLKLILYYDISVIGQTISAMEAAPIDELGTSESVRAFLAIRNELSLLSAAIEKYKEGVYDEPLIVEMKRQRAGMGVDAQSEVDSVATILDGMLVKRIRYKIAEISNYSDELKRISAS